MNRKIIDLLFENIIEDVNYMNYLTYLVSTKNKKI